MNGTLMTQMQRIDTDFIRVNLPYLRHQRAILTSVLAWLRRVRTDE